MATALLIGLKYQQEFKELPGIIVDLYHAYSYNKKIGSKICIITDIMTDENVKFLKEVVFTGVVNSDIISFITDIQGTSEHIAYTNAECFVNDIIDIVSNVRKLFVYYTGHGENGHLLLPQKGSISVEEFRNILLINTSAKADIITIMDCCNGDHMGIPFYLNNNNYRLIDRKSRIFPKQRIIHIASTKEDESSVATHQGSIFTAEIFNSLLEGNRDLRKEIRRISANCIKIYPQTASLYVSRPNIYTFWRWLYKNDGHNIIVNLNPEMGSLSIKLCEYDILTNEEDEMDICLVADMTSNLVR